MSREFGNLPPSQESSERSEEGKELKPSFTAERSPQTNRLERSSESDEQSLEDIRKEIDEIFKEQDGGDHVALPYILTEEMEDSTELSLETASPEYEPTLTTRHPELQDVPRLVEIELERYRENYILNPTPIKEIVERFAKRIRIAKRWMWVAEVDGRVEGFTTGQPTHVHPSKFESWEEATNNGTLEGVYHEEGENVYVVNLDVSRKGTKAGAQYHLMAALGEHVIKEGKKQVIFVSRMPGFREWILEKEKTEGLDWENLSGTEKDAIATIYRKERVLQKGKEVARDRLLRFYEEDGFTLGRLVREAFDDPESLSYGVLCHGVNPVPEKLRKIGLISWLGSKVFKWAAKHPELISKVIK